MERDGDGTRRIHTLQAVVNPCDAIVAEQQRAQAWELGKALKLDNGVVGQVDAIKLVLCDTQILNRLDLVAWGTCGAVDT